MLFVRKRGEYKRGSLILRKINNAKKRNLIFQISKEFAADLLVKPCVSCGKESVIEGYKECSGIDRIGNSKGYIDGNCVSCCFYCNSCKNNISVLEFIEHIKKYVLENGRAK
jgi:hypothetical protein